MPSTRAGSLRERSRRASSSALASLTALYAGRVSAGQAVHDGELPVLDGLSQCPLRGPGLCGYWLAHCGDQLRLQCLNALYAGRVSAGSNVMQMALMTIPSLNALYAGRVSAGIRPQHGVHAHERLSQCPLRGPGLRGASDMNAACDGKEVEVSMPSTRAGSLRVVPWAQTSPRDGGKSLNALYAGRVSAGVSRLARKARP